MQSHGAVYLVALYVGDIAVQKWTDQETWDFGLDPDQAFEPEDEEPRFDRALPHVMTALGPIDPESLGVALLHEFLFSRPHCDETDPLLDDPHHALSRLEEYYLAGGRSIVDMATADYGRDADTISWIAARSPVNIVVATGHHQDRYAAACLGSHNAEAIAAAMVTEVTNGIGETGVCAGIIVAGTSLNVVTPLEERVLRAAAWAQLETGAPISTVSDAGTVFLEQLAILGGEGAELPRVIVGHIDRNVDEITLHRILDTGAFMALDQISRDHQGQHEEGATMVKRLIDAGFRDQLLLSTEFGRRSAEPADGGLSGWTYMIESFPLLLMEQEVTATDVRRLLVDNPGRALTTRPSSRHIP